MRPNTLVVLALAALLASEAPLQAQATRSDAIDQALGSLRLREIGPALMGGRIADIAVHEDCLRQQLESELKSKLIALRERYLLTRGKPREITELLIQSLASLLVLFRAALRLYQADVPANKIDALLALTQHIEFDASPFQTVEQLKEGKKMPGLIPDDLFARYLHTTEAVVDAIDEFLHRKGGEGGPAA